MSFHFQVQYGWGAPSIADQMTAFGVEGFDAGPWQRHADAILRLSLHSLITPSQAKAARDKLMKKLLKHLLDEKLMVPASKGETA